MELDLKFRGILLRSVHLYREWVLSSISTLQRMREAGKIQECFSTEKEWYERFERLQAEHAEVLEVERCLRNIFVNESKIVASERNDVPARQKS